MQTLFKEAAALLAAECFVVQALAVPHFEDIFNEQDVPTPEDVRLCDANIDDLAVILHSSGTSAFPKPIQITHRRYVAFGTGACECATTPECMHSLIIAACFLW
jgi:acyl-coenzyme A synthetase/AMP-(fatty) acid ligase